VHVRGARVLVTGASRGIGDALARAFAAAGADVALVARSEGPLKELAAELGGTAYPTDLADTDQVSGLVERVEADGPLDVVVNNAGLDEVGWFPAMADDRLATILQVNLAAPMALCRHVIPRMLDRGKGHIVNVSSLSGVGMFPGLVAYSTTKAGLSHFTAGLRADLRGLPIDTTLVEVGPVPTDMLDGLSRYPPTVRSFRRFARIQLLPDVPKEKVAADVVEAVERRRRHVRHPKRALAFPLSVEWPRRLVEILLSGVPHRREKP
jgi:short-subunit dehydrogenase